LRSELVRAGFAGVDLQKTPLGVRITLKTSRPGLVIGKGGKRIQEITDVLQEKYGLELPQIEVEEVANPDLNAQIMAERLAYSLDRGRHYRRAAYYILRKVMDAGALGVEISIAGKVTSQRAKTQRFRTGTMAKSGQLAQIGVDKGIAQCITKTGVLGVKVKIMRPNVRTGDGVKINEELLKQAEAKAEAELTKTKAGGPVKKGLEVIEEETPLSEDEKELLDVVDEEDTSEISLEPEDEKKEENLKTKKKVKDNEDSES